VRGCLEELGTRECAGCQWLSGVMFGVGRGSLSITHFFVVVVVDDDDGRCCIHISHTVAVSL